LAIVFYDTLSRVCLYDDKLCTHVNKRYSLFCSDNVFGRNQT